MFPNFIKYSYMPIDFRYNRNVAAIRGEIQKMIDDRRKGLSSSEGDLLTILINTEFYKDQDEMMIDEIFTFFLAGMKTI